MNAILPFIMIEIQPHSGFSLQCSAGERKTDGFHGMTMADLAI
jgi:hypothetical protein